MTRDNTDLSYSSLNALINLYDKDGKLQTHKDKEAARQYFLQHVNENTVFFHTLQEKIDYLVSENYYEKEWLDQYDFEFIKSLFQRAYAVKFRFETFLGALKYYTSYTLKNKRGDRYLERFEDRVAVVALYLAGGDEDMATKYLDEMMSGRFQPATPTFLNLGKAARGEPVSCFLLRTEDNMESIARVINGSLQLSKRGGGVAISLTNLREQGAPIKGVEGQSSGVIPVMKLLEDAFSYANQLGARQGAGAAYLNVHHPDIMQFLDTKRENADEKIRIKTLSLGLVVPDVTFELARTNKPMYLFSPYDVERVYGVPFGDISITEKYDEMVLDERITKTKISARDLFSTIAEIQFESGYPYLMFEDTVNKANPIKGRVSMSNLCQPGDARINTTTGYRRLDDLYKTQEDFKVVVDTRARDMDLLKVGTSVEESTKMFKTAENAEIFKITTSEGFENRATSWHKYYVNRNGSLIKIPLNEIVPGDKLLIQSGGGSFGTESNPELAYLAGAVAADGTILQRSEKHRTLSIALYGEKAEAFGPRIESYTNKVLEGRGANTAAFKEGVDGGHWMYSAGLAHLLSEYGVDENSKTTVPEFVMRGDKETVRNYLSGLLGLDGGQGGPRNGAWEFSITSIDNKLLRDVQMLLLNFEIYSRIYAVNAGGGSHIQTDASGKETVWNHSPSWRLKVTDRISRSNLCDVVDFKPTHLKRIEESNAQAKVNAKARHDHFATVTSVTHDGIEDVYDVTVDNGNSVIFNGIATGNCSEILQVSTPSTYDENLDYIHVGRDISCNLGSLNIAKVMESGDINSAVNVAIHALSEVSDRSNIRSVPSVERGNKSSHAVGLGQMNLHGFLATSHIHYGSEEGIDFTNMYFYAVAFAAYTASNEIAIKRGETFLGFEDSQYADGSYFEKYITQEWKPATERIANIFKDAGIKLPTQEDWKRLSESIQEHGMYNAYLMAVPPTGSISYINNSTSSIHPIAAQIEVRKEGKLGRVYYPAYKMDDENRPYYVDAYEIGYEKIIDTYAAATQHTDQGLSLTLFFKEGVTTRTLNKAQIYAWRKGIKTLYYIRLRQNAIDGLEPEDCVSCTL